MPTLSAARESVLYDTANYLLNARRTGVPVNDLPVDLMPASDEEAFVVQDFIMQAYGEIGGWKIGARGADATPSFGPMPLLYMGENGALFRGPLHRLHGVEAEIAFRIGKDLPVRTAPYTREEVIAAIESCHPAIEVLESAFTDPKAVPREAMLADLQMNGGFVAGPAVPQWQTINWAVEHVTLAIDGSIRVENIGSNPGGSDLLRLLMFLANEGQPRTHGLKAGAWVTTGSWTGATWATAHSGVTATFVHAGQVGLQFA